LSTRSATEAEEDEGRGGKLGEERCRGGKEGGGRERLWEEEEDEEAEAEAEAEAEDAEDETESPELDEDPGEDLELVDEYDMNERAVVGFKSGMTGGRLHWW